MTTSRHLVSRAALYSLLSAWTTLTVASQTAVQLPGGLGRLSRRLSVAVPLYRFFGPNPGVHDRDLIVRSRDADGTVGPWRRFVLSRDRRPWHTVWAPHRRLEKSVADSASHLSQICRSIGNIPRVKDTVAYRALLNLALYGADHGPEARAVQFGVVMSCRHDPAVAPSTVFTSDFHDLPGRAPTR